MERGWKQVGGVRGRSQHLAVEGGAGVGGMVTNLGEVFAPFVMSRGAGFVIQRTRLRTGETGEGIFLHRDGGADPWQRSFQGRFSDTAFWENKREKKKQPVGSAVK